LRGAAAFDTIQVMLRTALIALAVLVLPLTAAADIYSYTDANGVVVFTTKPAPQAKLYMKTVDRTAGPTPRPGVVPVAPQDKDVARFTRYSEHIRAGGE
jgi:hypothetical protein